MAVAGTSFYQFSYCSLCKLSHKQRKKKHIYSPRHQTILKNVLSKFTKKIADVKASVGLPVVHAVGWESDARLWCYFCQSEVSRHQLREECTVANAILVEHLSLTEHAKKMHTFFWENFIPPSKKADFVVSKEETLRFLENAEKAVEKYLKDEKEKLLQAANRIRAVERKRQATNEAIRLQELVKSPSVLAATPESTLRFAKQETDGWPRPEAGGQAGKKTLSAFGPGLTCLPTTKKEDGEWRGNVHTGAPPPWLMDDEVESTGEIGPTADTFNKHLKEAQKQKLPPGRVGASFNHKVDTSTEWLPSFGRVWSIGRRQNSKQQFLPQHTRGRGQHARGRGQYTRGGGQYTRGGGQYTRGGGQYTRGRGSATATVGSSPYPAGREVDSRSFERGKSPGYRDGLGQQPGPFGHSTDPILAALACPSNQSSSFSTDITRLHASNSGPFGHSTDPIVSAQACSSNQTSSFSADRTHLHASSSARFGRSTDQTSSASACSFNQTSSFSADRTRAQSSSSGPFSHSTDQIPSTSSCSSNPISSAPFSADRTHLHTSSSVHYGGRNPDQISSAPACSSSQISSAPYSADRHTYLHAPHSEVHRQRFDSSGAVNKSAGMHGRESGREFVNPRPYKRQKREHVSASSLDSPLIPIAPKLLRSPGKGGELA